MKILILSQNQWVMVFISWLKLRFNFVEADDSLTISPEFIENPKNLVTFLTQLEASNPDSEVFDPLKVEHLLYKKLLKNYDNLAIDDEPCDEKSEMGCDCSDRSGIVPKIRCDGVIKIDAEAVEEPILELEPTCSERNYNQNRKSPQDYMIRNDCKKIIEIWTTSRDTKKRFHYSFDGARKANITPRWQREKTMLGKIFTRNFAKYKKYSAKNSDDTTNRSYYKNFNLKINLEGKNSRKQRILGFGGALTDATVENLINISGKKFNNLDEKLLSLYFGDHSIRYSILRLPIAATDFSNRTYTYADEVENDFELRHFKLQNEDYDKFHYLRQIKNRIDRENNQFCRNCAQKRKNEFLKKPDFLATPWSPPTWLKSNGKLTTYSTLKGRPGNIYHKTWAKYIVKFLQEYKKHGNITFTYLTAQNEPNHGGFWPGGWQTMGFSWRQMANFIMKDLGPILTKNGFSKDKLNLIVHDDVRIFMDQPENILKDMRASKFISGVGVHWYRNQMSPLSTLDSFAEKSLKNDNKFILATEACHEKMPLKKKNIYQQWFRAEKYAIDILENLNHHVSGWLDWNLALDLNGGPNWAKNFVDSPILVGEDYFLIQPMYFIMGHFSRFLPKNSVILDYKLTDVVTGDAENPVNEELSPLKCVVAENPEDKSIVVIFLNVGSDDVSVTIENLGYQLDLEAKSISTLSFYL